MHNQKFLNGSHTFDAFKQMKAVSDRRNLPALFIIDLQEIN
ncbi:hypothetical protein [Nostoc sp. C117]